MKNEIKVSDSTAVSMPMKNLIAIVIAVATGVWAYFGVLERITMLETKSTLAEKDLNQAIATIGADLEKNTEFRIKWPRGEMGSLPADSEQFMLIEDLYKTTEKLTINQEMNTSNKLRIEFMEKQISKMLDDIEKLKDQNREIKYTNGNGNQ